MKFEGEAREHEVVVRHGDAPMIHNYKPMALAGRFDAPAEFVKKRYNADVDLLDKYTSDECHVIFDKKNLTITVVAGEQERDTITVTGVLKKDPFLDSLKINSGAHSNKGLLEIIRYKQHLFVDREAHKKLVTGLQKFEVKTSSEHSDVNDRLGTKGASNFQTASNQLTGTSYQLRVPLFEGYDPVIIDLTVEIEPSNGSAIIYLVSETFDEFWDQQVDQQFDSHEETFAPFVIIRRNG